VIPRIIASMQLWMMRIIQQHGFVGILLLASWPNAAFDLCGICCGAFKMPFWSFFGATLIGKGGVKVSGQALFFVALFRQVGVDGGWGAFSSGRVAFPGFSGCSPLSSFIQPDPPAHPPPTPTPHRSTPLKQNNLQASRDTLLSALASILPTHLPGAAPGAPPPAAALKSFVDGQIARFQARVVASAAEHRSETRWWWTRAGEYLRLHLGSGAAPARAWAAAQVPDTVSEVWGWVIFVLIAAFAVSCVNALAQGQKAWAEEEARKGAAGGRQHGSKASKME